MNIKSTFLFLAFLISNVTLFAQEIPIELLTMDLQSNEHEYSKTVLKNEINGVQADYEVVTDELTKNISIDKAYRTIYLFIKGHGKITSKTKTYDIVPESILLPNTVEGITMRANKNDTLQYVKISVLLSEQDIQDLKSFPKENIETIYFKKFIDCKPYTEAIKSPQTTSRTILSNKYIPRVAMGTVETIGPDEVGAHKHPMLEQLFLGLTNNQTIVFADDAKVDFPEYSLLHIPLGSNHSVAVKDNNKMYYVWMDFFLDKKGEEWLKTHKTDED
ncbi:hypothetical protein [Formosa haliotis]|uniref:hypothetical protein n=1 Tax=Formosa haliotis TaxID=1555194 RepID=UPI0008245910|nr:hypothetical protein [Formosa haliotis]